MVLYKKYIVAEFIKWIYILYPVKQCLPNLNEISYDIVEWLDKEITKEIVPDMIDITDLDLRKYCKRISHEIPSIKILNLSKIEMEVGHYVSSGWRRSGDPTKDELCDFIDLDALSQNVFIDLYKY